MDTQDNPSFLSTLLAPTLNSVQSKLPTKQEVIQDYLAATVTFWVVGGITLFIVASVLKRK